MQNAKELFGKFEIMRPKDYRGKLAEGENVPWAVSYSGSFFDTLELAKLPQTQFVESLKETLTEQTPRLQDSLTRSDAKSTLENRAYTRYEMEIKEKGYLRGDEGFCGGTREDLYSTPKQARIDAVKALNFNEKYKSLCFERGDIMKRRRRVKCAHDGEWDMSRKWEQEPFMKRRSTPVLTKTVKINAHICFSGWTESKTIDKYGVYVAALTNYLESIGIGVELNVKSYSIGTIRSPDALSLINMNVKKPDQYLPVTTLLQAFSANFYRRMLFTFKIANAAAIAGRVDGGLGRPLSWGKSFEVNKDLGEINLYTTIDVDQGTISTDIIKDALDAFIGA